MTAVHNEWHLGYEYRPQKLSKEAFNRYECLVRYGRLRAKNFSEREALEFLGVKRSTYFSRLKRYKNKCGNQQMKTTELANKSRRPDNFRKSKIISPQLVSHILKIRQAEPMLGKEKIKRELEKAGVFVLVSTVGRVLKYLMDKYNCERMHQSLNYLTPMEYYYKLKENSA